MRRAQLRNERTKAVSVLAVLKRGSAAHECIYQNQRKGIVSMRRQNKIRIQRQRRRKFFWLFAAAAVSASLFDEQVAVLYVLSTLAMCGLLIVVAFSNLEARDVEMQAAIGKDEPRNEWRSGRNAKN